MLDHDYLFVTQNAPVVWDKTNDTMTSEERLSLISGLEALCQKAAMAAAYFAEREGHGCGDQGHDAGVKKANRVLRALRKAQGYTYPSRGCFTF